MDEKIKFACAFCVLSQKPILQQSRKLFQENQIEASSAVPVQSETHISEKIDKLVEITKTIINTEIPTDKKKQERIPLESKTDVDSILIIDNINVENPITLRDSRNIRKELNKIPSLANKVESAYSLSHGGIAVHLKNKKDCRSILKNWEETNLGGKSVIHPPKSIQQEGHKVAYLHNIPPSLDEVYIESVLSENYNIRKLHRLKYRDTGKPLPVVRITFEDTGSARRALNSEGFYIPQSDTRERFEPERKAKAIRCYKCNRLGHIAKVCSYKQNCSNCAREDCSDRFCQTAPKCMNCDGNHPSSAKRCPKYQQVLRRLKVQRILNTEECDNEDPFD